MVGRGCGVEGFAHVDAFRQIDAVQCDGDRFGKGGFFKLQRLGDAIEDAGRKDDLLGKAAVAAILGRGDAEDFALGAKVDVAGLAFGAVAAVLRGVKGDAVAHGPVGDAFAQFADFACCLVAHDDGREAASAASVHAMDVAAADAAGVDADFDLAWAGLRLREIHVVVELGGSGEDKGVHEGKAEMESAETRRVNGFGSQRL